MSETEKLLDVNDPENGHVILPPPRPRWRYVWYTIIAGITAAMAIALFIMCLRVCACRGDAPAPTPPAPLPVSRNIITYTGDFIETRIFGEYDWVELHLPEDGEYVLYQLVRNYYSYPGPYAWGTIWLYMCAHADIPIDKSRGTIGDCTNGGASSIVPPACFNDVSCRTEAAGPTRSIVPGGTVMTFIMRPAIYPNNTVIFGAVKILSSPWN